MLTPVPTDKMEKLLAVISESYAFTVGIGVVWLKFIVSVTRFAVNQHVSANSDLTAAASASLS